MTSSDSSAGIATSPGHSVASKRLLPWLVAVAFFMESLDTTILNTAVPAISAALHVGPLSMKAVLASYTLSLAVFIPISGWVADRFKVRDACSPPPSASSRVAAPSCAASSSTIRPRSSCLPHPARLRRLHDGARRPPDSGPHCSTNRDLLRAMSLCFHPGNGIAPMHRAPIDRRRSVATCSRSRVNCSQHPHAALDRAAVMAAAICILPDYEVGNTLTRYSRASSSSAPASPCSLTCSRSRREHTLSAVEISGLTILSLALLAGYCATRKIARLSLMLQLSLFKHSYLRDARSVGSFFTRIAHRRRALSAAASLSGRPRLQPSAVRALSSCRKPSPPYACNGSHLASAISHGLSRCAYFEHGHLGVRLICLVSLQSDHHPDDHRESETR